jgi:hypothetical protein
VSSPTLFTLVSPQALAAAPGWSPVYFTGPASVAIRASSKGFTVDELGGEVLEGWRVSETPTAENYDRAATTTPIYRQSNVGRLRLVLSPVHWKSPNNSPPWCVQPGDVVLNKLAPVRAALVSPAARRHPVDGNSLIVRGLPWSIATWLAVCLNRPEYQQVLESGVLRRVGLAMLANLRLPQVPPEMTRLSAMLRDLLDEMLLLGETIQRVKDEAAEIAAAPLVQRDLRQGIFIRCESISSDSWLPTAMSLRAEQSALAEDFGWVPIQSLAVAGDRSRLQSAPDGGRVLRLSDVADDLFVASVEQVANSGDLSPGRTLARPLVPGEVLLSTVGTSFRVAYVDEGVAPNTFPSDCWVRLRFLETPAAWALLLSSDHVRLQTSRLAIGSVQQFVPPEALLSIHVPVPERETRDRWQRVIQRAHAQLHTLERRWNTLQIDLTHVFENVHGLPLSRPPEGNEALQ